MRTLSGAVLMGADVRFIALMKAQVNEHSILMCVTFMRAGKAVRAGIGSNRQVTTDQRKI